MSPSQTVSWRTTSSSSPERTSPREHQVRPRPPPSPATSRCSSTPRSVPSSNQGLRLRLCSVFSASKPKYTFDFSEEEEDEAEEEENGEDDVAASPVRSPKEDFPSTETKNRYNDHEDEDEDEDNGISFSPPKQKPT